MFKIPDFDPVKFLLKTCDERGVSLFRTEDSWIMGWDPSKHATSYDELRGSAKGIWIGCFYYDLPKVSTNYYEKFLRFDAKTGEIFTDVFDEVCRIWEREACEVPTKFGLKFKAEMSKDFYDLAFQKIKRYILDGDIYQVNLTHRLTADFDGDLRALFAKICETNPAPFCAYIECDDCTLLSASPERFIRLNGKNVRTCPVKGTRPRGETPEEDERLRRELVENEKESAELSMITDLLRNDIGQVCEIGSVRVAEHRAIQKCPTVWHTYSLVEGVLRSDLDAVDLLRACMPGGSITGCPKKRAMEIIDELEPIKRGAYTGAIGYIDSNGNMDTSIIIRTLIAHDGKLYLNVGGGIVADSENRAEYQETLDKAKSFLNL